MKHTSTLLAPSIPFHTLVKLVDAEDKVNDKRRTHDLTLEVNPNTNQLQSQNLETHHPNTLCLHNPEARITNTNLHIEPFIHFVIEQTIPYPA